MQRLSGALADGACLIDSTRSAAPPDLRSALLIRLSQYYARLGSVVVIDNTKTLEEVELITAKEALSVVGRVQQVLGVEDETTFDQAPVIGTRDLAELRTLLSIIFKWGVDPLLSALTSAWPSQTLGGGPRIIDLTAAPEDYGLLSDFVSALMTLIFPFGSQGQLPQTLITTTILHRHVADLLRPCIALGWLPKSLASDSTPTLDSIRPLTMRLLAILPPSQTIAALGGVISSTPPPPPHVHRTCAYLLSRQLLRPEGVRGLLSAIFGEEEASDEAPLKKLEYVARVVTAVPAGMKPETYFHTIIPRVVGLLSENVPSAFRRAAAFVVARMLATDDVFAHQTLSGSIFLDIVHQPLFQLTHEPLEQAAAEEEARSASPYLAPSRALSILLVLIPNMDPSPTLISKLLTPVASALYSLLHHIDRIRTSDPSLKESLRGLLITWGKIVTADEGINILWSVLVGEGGNWEVDLEGNIKRLKKLEKASSLSLLTPEDLQRAGATGELDVDANLFDLYPDPVHFVHFSKEIDRADISSELFVRLLEAYRNQKTQGGSPMRALLYLQIIIQMQTQLSNGSASSDILRKPMHMLMFVKHVLESAATPSEDERHSMEGVGSQMESLRLDSDTDSLSDEGDSDDDTPGADIILPDDEMMETSLNLLLSILEANDNLSARTMPVLNEIFSLLEPLARNGSSSLRSLSREARIVMTARLASTSVPRRISAEEGEENAQDVYQKALKLLQDPILPVRAHGLLLLRQLVSSTPAKSTREAKRMDPALVPGILSIFLQSIQDDDSYMFLNAVQGLAAMVDAFGKEVLKGLVKEYSRGLDSLGGGNLTQQDLDIRIRVGEALGIIIKQCGETLGAYVDLMVPTLFNIVRSPHVPTTLRTSSLSLLGECESTQPLALLPYAKDLAEAMVDLLQIESVSIHHQPQPVEQEDRPTIDFAPTSRNSKFPPLRRAALHFLALLIRETTRQVYDSSYINTLFSPAAGRRMKTTLVYVAATDEDNVVRMMAREAGEALDQLEQAIIGI